MKENTSLDDLRQCIDIMEKTFGSNVTREFMNKQIYGSRAQDTHCSMWAARDYNGCLKLYTNRPVKKGDQLREKRMFLSDGGFWMNANMLNMPEVSWENSPVMVSLRVMSAADIEDIEAEEA